MKTRSLLIIAALLTLLGMGASTAQAAHWNVNLDFIVPVRPARVIYERPVYYTYPAYNYYVAEPVYYTESYRQYEYYPRSVRIRENSRNHYDHGRYGHRRY